MRDFIDFLKFAFFEIGPIFLFVCALILIPTILIGRVLISSDCKSYGEITGREVKVDCVSGCYVLVDGEFIHRSQIRKVEITND